MSVVWTIEEKCNRCYTCIRECPAKAIKVENGQAKVIASRCVGCGHCVSVCSQGAKAVLNAEDMTLDLLQKEHCVAIVAPSFPAVYPDYSPETVVGAIKACGFKQVLEVAFGADLINKQVNHELNNLHQGDSKQVTPIIASSCPAIVTYVQKYVPDLVGNLAPIVSPMIAMARVARYYYGDDIRIFFIGPCTAKKKELQAEDLEHDLDAVLTFAELDNIWKKLSIDPQQAQPVNFDPPHGYLGRAYPVSGGFIRSAGLPTDVMNEMVLVTEGKGRILKLLESIQENQVSNEIIDALFCEGCINGPFSNNDVNYFNRRQSIVKYTETGRRQTDFATWRRSVEECLNAINLTRSFTADPISLAEASESEIREILEKIGKYKESDELNCGACGYSSCRDFAEAAHAGLAETDMCLPYLIEKMEYMQKELKNSMDTLAETQEQLIQHEKLASIGQLAAGVAHEVNNPLGSIMLYAHLIRQRLNEDNPVQSDLKFIQEEARRCQKISSGLLNFSRQGNLTLSEKSINQVIKKLQRAIQQQKQFKNVQIETDLQADVPNLFFDDDQIYQVFLNLAINSAEAMPDGGTLTISSRVVKDRIHIYFKDTGVGISKENHAKLFTPFFTTKQIGKGTGLGLAIAYGIIKMHKGNIRALEHDGQGALFLVDLPIRTDELTI